MFAGILTQAKGLIGISGTFSKSSAPSGGIVTSDPITLIVPGGSDGMLTVSGQVDTGTVTLEFRRNAGGYTGGIPAGAAANGDTMNARITGATAGEASTFTISELTSGRVVGGPYTITAI